MKNILFSENSKKNTKIKSSEVISDHQNLPCRAACGLHVPCLCVGMNGPAQFHNPIAF